MRTLNAEGQMSILHGYRNGLNKYLFKGVRKREKNAVRISELCRLPSSHKNERKEKRKKKGSVKRDRRRKEGRKGEKLSKF